MFALKEFNLDHLVLLFILNSSPTPKYILQGISTSIATREMPLTFKIFQIFQPQDPEKKWIKEKNTWFNLFIFTSSNFVADLSRILSGISWIVIHPHIQPRGSSHPSKAWHSFYLVSKSSQTNARIFSINSFGRGILCSPYRKDFLYSGDCQQYIADSISLCFQQTSTNIQRICP